MCHLRFGEAFRGALLLLALMLTVYGQEVPAPEARRLKEEPGEAARESEPEEFRRRLSAQQAEIERLRTELAEQARLIRELVKRVEKSEETPTTTQEVAKTTEPAAAANRTSVARAETPSAPEPRTAPAARAEETTRRTPSFTLSGDLRLRYESFYGQLNALPNAGNPAIAGNELSTRQRGRLRLRLALRGQLTPEVDWGVRFATGNFADDISTNQTLTDFFTRKPFGLDQAFVTYRPRAVPGLRLQGGKFEQPWVSTEMLFDNDLSYEGLNQSYSRDFKRSLLKNITLAAWQLPFMERASGFVRNSDGSVNLDQSKRAGRDLALYGGQVRTRLELAPQIALTLSAANHHYAGTQFISPAQVFGGQLQIPVSVTVPATPTSPAQTVTGVASIPRDLLVTGNGNLGLSTASNNAVNRDGRLASGFNLVDLIGRLDLTRSRRFPVTLLLDVVTNTQVRDVVVVGPGGANRILRNRENRGYWAEVQVGKTQQRGDALFGYTFIRIEKDAVLTSFNYSDLAQQSDVRAQRFVAAYAADQRVVLSLTATVSGRPNGLLGVFGATPPGSLNRPTTRLQLDTLFRF